MKPTTTRCGARCLRRPHCSTFVFTASETPPSVPTITSTRKTIRRVPHQAFPRQRLKAWEQIDGFKRLQVAKSAGRGRESEGQAELLWKLDTAASDDHGLLENGVLSSDGDGTGATAQVFSPCTFMVFSDGYDWFPGEKIVL